MFHFIIIVGLVFISLSYGTFTHFKQRQCELNEDCVYDTVGKSILIAIDGTWTRQYFEDEETIRKWSSQIGVNHNQEWIWKSHIANFWEDYQDAALMIKAGNEVEQIFSRATEQICNFVDSNFNITSSKQALDMTLNGELGIDVIGFSRGGFAAMELARKLQYVGCNDIKPIYVRFLGLFDPVQRDIDFTDVFETYDNTKIGTNVISVSIAERSKRIGSRRYFGYAVKGYDVEKGYPLYRHQTRFDASHGGLGGAPEDDAECKDKPSWNDIMARLCSSSYSLGLDKQGSQSADIFMRYNAVQIGVPIKLQTQYYYNGFRDYLQ